LVKLRQNRRGNCGFVNRQGVRVVVADIDESRSTAIADKLRNSGGDAIGVAVDVTAEASVAALFEKVIAHFEAVDILVNNAGFTVIGVWSV
jgi:3-hydroxybutyrate dehydrogenase